MVIGHIQTVFQSRTCTASPFHLLNIEEHIRGLPSELYDLVVSILFGIVKWSLLVEIDAFVGLVARSNQELKDVKISILTGYVHGVLLVTILSFYVSIILDQKICKLFVVRLDRIVQGTKERVWLLEVNIDCHVSSILNADHLSNDVVVAVFCRVHEPLAVLEVQFPPGTPKESIVILHLFRGG